MHGKLDEVTKEEYKIVAEACRGKFGKVKTEDKCYYQGILKVMRNLSTSALVLKGRPRKGLVHFAEFY